jgi:hypothetical protein
MNEPVLKTEDVDRLGHALLTLTKELWVLRDRQRILEAALEEAGVLPAGVVDAYEPGETLKAALRAERRQLIDAVLDTLSTEGD